MNKNWQNKYLMDHEFLDYLYEYKIRYCYTSHEFRNEESKILGSIDIRKYYELFEDIIIGDEENGKL